MTASSELKQIPAGASDMAHIVLTFDNNRLASALFGQFDENVAMVEKLAWSGAGANAALRAGAGDACNTVMPSSAGRRDALGFG